MFFMRSSVCEILHSYIHAPDMHKRRPPRIQVCEIVKNRTRRETEKTFFCVMSFLRIYKTLKSRRSHVRKNFTFYTNVRAMYGSSNKNKYKIITITSCSGA